ncbi:hypothetical protein [Mesorhizobium sp. 131-2-1]|nr:hypothetical protein [Mesorhizobium sp. 131-2-1]
MKLTSYGLEASQRLDQGPSKLLEGRYFGRPWFRPILGAYYRMKDLVT